MRTVVLGGAAAVLSLALVASASAAIGSTLRAGRPQVAAAVTKVLPEGRLLTISSSLGSGVAKRVGQSPVGVTAQANGKVIVVDDQANVVRQVTTKGYESVLAGDGVAGYNGDGRTAASASLDGPEASIPVRGGFAIADTVNQRVRYVATSSCASACPFGLPATASGNIYTIAGNGIAGNTGDSGLATNARLDGPAGLAKDAAGDLLEVETYSGVVRMIATSSCAVSCPFGLTSTTAGHIYLIAGIGRYGSAGNGGVATSARLAAPTGIAIDGSGDVLIADSGNNEIRMVAAGACSANCPFGVSPTVPGDIYLVAGTGAAGQGGNTGPAAAATLDAPSALAIGPHGDLLIADTLSYSVRMVGATACSQSCPFGTASVTVGDIYAIAGSGVPGSSGDGGAASAATLDAPSGLSVDSGGNLLIADPSAAKVREVASATCSGSCRYGLARTTANSMYTVAGTGSTNGSGDGSSVTGAEFRQPAGITTGDGGDLFVADSGNNKVRLVAARSCTSGCAFGLKTSKGDVYTIAGKQTAGSGGDGGPSSQAYLSDPVSVAVGNSGDLLIADKANNKIRLVAAVTCSLSCPYGLASTKAGYIYTIAGTGQAGDTGNGGSARQADLNRPAGVAIGPSGDVVVSDTGNDLVRLIAATSCTSRCPYGLASTTTGDIYAIAGTGKAGYSGDKGPARKATLSDPTAIALGPSGSLLVADGLNNRVRLLADSSCRASCPYGLATTAGYLYTVAGNGSFGSSGNQQLATKAAITRPTGLAVDPVGDLFVTDTTNDVVRVVWNETCANSCLYGAPSARPGEISAVAGNGSLQPSIDGQPVLGRALAGPTGLAPASGGGILVLESANGAIRQIRPVPPDGYDLVTTAGGVHNFGSPFYGSINASGASHVVGIASDAHTGGYWLAGADGSVHNLGGAPFMGSLRGHKLRAPIVAITSTPSGAGYWLAGADGEVYPFGAARSHGSLLGKLLSKPVVAMVSASNGGGYWLVTRAGQVFSFGNAHGYGSASHVTDVVSMASSPSYHGYYLAESDGQLLTFGNATNRGTLLHKTHSGTLVAISVDASTGGYRLATSTGEIFDFHAPNYGSPGALTGAIGLTTGE